MRAQQIRFMPEGFFSALIVSLVSGCGGVDSGGTGAVSMGPITGLARSSSTACVSRKGPPRLRMRRRPLHANRLLLAS